MDKTSGELDQSFVESVIGGPAAILQPKVLQHVMSLVIAPGVKALKVSQVTRIEGSLPAASLQFTDKHLDTLRFFHGRVQQTPFVDFSREGSGFCRNSYAPSSSPRTFGKVSSY